MAVVAACGGTAPHVEKTETLDCSAPSRACTLRELAAVTPDLAGFAATTYGAYGTAAFGKLHARGFDPLIVDPAVVLHVDGFLAFDAKTTDPWLARQRYAATLGTHRIYRAVAVDDATFASIHDNGILAPTVRSKHAPYNGHILDLLALHVTGGQLEADPLMSVSDDAAIAKCVAHGFAKAGSYVAVYTADVPVFDVLAIDGASALCPPMPAAGSLDCHQMAPPFSDEQRGMMCRATYSAAIESFVHSRIDPKEIVNVQKPTDFSDCDDAMRRAGHDFAEHVTVAHAACKP
ncbi:MAG: hypothetical protein QM831_36715 [Kofleriaceae bacterium]